MLLRRLREAACLTQEELAERAGLSAKAISAWERGERQRPYPDSLRRLAAALDLSEGDRARLVGSVRSTSAEGSVVTTAVQQRADTQHAIAVDEGQTTLLLSDVERSDGEQEADPVTTARARAVHDRAVTDEVERQGGRVLSREDGVLVAFPTATQALAAAAAVQRELAARSGAAGARPQVRVVLDSVAQDARRRSAQRRCARLRDLAGGRPGAAHRRHRAAGARLPAPGCPAARGGLRSPGRPGPARAHLPAGHLRPSGGSPSARTDG